MKLRKAMTSTLWISLCVLLHACMSECMTPPDSADILFKTNIQEMVDHPIIFDKPLPTWLKGTLVS